MATTIKQLILDKVEESFKIAEAFYGRTFDRPRSIIWNEKTTTGGYCSWREKTLMFNPILAMENEDDFITQTVPHEVAHWIDQAVYGISYKRTNRGKVRWILHGPNWKYIMERVYKIPADVTHSYDVTNTRGRVVARDFIYTCPCNTKFEITTSIHNKMRKGQVRICGKCKGHLKLVETKTAEQIQLEKLTRQLELLKRKQG